MHRVRLALIASAALASLALVATGSAGVASKAAPKAGGTVTFAAEQIPPCLNGFLSGCNNTWTSWTAGIAFRGLYIVKPNFAIVPDMAAGPAQIISKKPFTLLVKINPKAVWSDGKPITVADLKFTAATILNPKWDIAGRSGWDSLKGGANGVVQVNAKTAKLVFAKPYGPWKVMLASSILPAHALAGADFNNVWNDNNNDPHTGKPIASGPWMLGPYVQGQSITLVRNPKGFPHPAKLDKLVFVFRTNTDSEIQALRGGEVDAIYPQAQLQLADLKRSPGIAYQSNSGTTIEHLDLNVDPKGTGSALLRNTWFRQALAYGMDRDGMVKQLYRTLTPNLRATQNLTYPPNSPEYKPHYAIYKYSPSKVASIMKAHGCKKGGDGIFVCGGKRASIKFSTTAGNKLRELAQEILQAQEKAAGIEITIANVPSGTLFGKLLPNHDYDMALYAWVTSGDPAGQVDIYGVGGGSNYTGIADPTVTKLFHQSDEQFDPVKRAALVNAADARQATVDVSTIPLYMKPTFFFYKKTLKGVVDNPTLQGPTWNSENWTVG